MEKVRQSLASKHAETVKESEKQMRLLQQERQAVFQDAFQSDLQYYKEVGKIPSENNNMKIICKFHIIQIPITLSLQKLKSNIK